MFRRTLTAVAVLAAALAAAGTSSAGVTCQTNAAAEVAGANVNGPRAGWDPPVWTFDMPDLNMSVDVQDYTHDGAAGKAQAWLQSQVDGACSAQQAQAPTNPDGSPAAPSQSAPTASASPAITQRATDLVNAATVVYLGNSWGPTPLYEVQLPSLNMTIDVAANSPADARANVLPTVIVALGGTWGTVDTTTTTASTPAPAPSAPTSTSVVTDTTVLSQPVAGANMFGTLDPAIAAAVIASS